MTTHTLRFHRLARAAAALCVAPLASPAAYAAEACHVNGGGASPAGCMATTTWAGTGQYEPSIITVVSGGQYTQPGSGLTITNANTSAPAGNSGTRGIYAYGQSIAPVPTPSIADIAGDVSIRVTATNVFNPTSNEGVYASTGALISIGGGLRVATSTSNPAYDAQAVVAIGMGVGAMATTASRVLVGGALDADTTQAAQTDFAVEAADGGQITVGNGGAIRSARSGLYVRTGAGGVVSSFSSTGAALLSVQAGGNGVTMEGTSNGNAGTVRLANAAITANDSGVRLHNNATSSTLLYRQSAGSITSTQGSAMAFTGGIGTATVDLIDTAVSTTLPAPGGADPDGLAMGYAVISTSAANNRLHMNGGSITGPIAIETGASLWLDTAGTVWNAAGNPASANTNSMTGMSGTLTIQMPDILDRIDLEGNTPSLGAGCGTASVTLVVPTNQPAPPASPHMVMQCKNAAAAPTVVLQGGSVVLGGFVYTLQTSAADGRVAYNLVRGAEVPPQPPGAGGVTSVPTLSQWGVMLLSALSALLGLGALQSRRRG